MQKIKPSPGAPSDSRPSAILRNYLLLSASSRVGGKTGTADKLDPNGGYAVDKRIASVLSAFPMDNPRYVVMAMVDEPKPTDYSFGYATGGGVAAPIVKAVVERMAPLLGIQPQADPAQVPVSSDAWNPQLIPVNLRGRHVAAR